MPLLPVVLVAALVVGVWAALWGLADREPGRALLQALLALQLLLLVQGGLGLARVAGPGVAQTGSFLGYLVLSVLLLPGAMALAVQERSKWASFVVGFACLVVAVVELRLGATA